jgi:hypothetical protein
MSRTKNARKVALSILLLMLAFVSLGSGTCVLVEEGPPGALDDPGVNADAMEDQEIDVINESDR